MAALRRVLVVLLMLIAGGVATVAAPGRAFACSCSQPAPPAEAIAASPLAVIGRVVDVGPPAGDFGDFEHIVQVTEVIKGDPGEQISIYARPDDGSCGITLQRGVDIGLVPHQFEGRLSVNMCGGTYTPEQLRDAQRGLPEPTGEGPIAMLLAGQWIDSQLTALDEQGRPLGYVFFPPGLQTTEADVCPGGATALVLSMAEVASLVTVDLANLEVTDVVDLGDEARTDEGYFNLRSLQCLAPDGKRAAVMDSGLDFEPRKQGRIIVVDDGDVKPFNAPLIAALDRIGDGPEVAWVDGGGPGGDVHVSDLVTGETSTIAKLGIEERAVALAVDPATGNIAIAKGTEIVEQFYVSVTTISTISPTGTKIADLTVPATLIPAMSWTADGFVFRSGYDGRASLIDFTTGTAVITADNANAASTLGGSLMWSSYEPGVFATAPGGTKRDVAPIYNTFAIAPVYDGVEVNPGAVQLRNPDTPPPVTVTGGSGGTTPGSPTPESAPPPVPITAPPATAAPTTTQGGGATVTVKRERDGDGFAAGWVAVAGGSAIGIAAIAMFTRRRRHAAGAAAGTPTTFE